MLKKIDIVNFGPYKDFKWKHSVKEEKNEFQKINILYGRNYAGKTSLSRLIRSIEKKQLHEHIENPNFKIVDNTNNEYTHENLHTAPYEVKVYNSDYVKENFAFFYNENEKITAFTVLGEENIETQIQIEKINKDIRDEIKPELDNKKVARVEAKTTYDKLDIEIETFLTDEARNIRNDTKYFTNPNFNKNSIGDIIKKLHKIYSIEELTDKISTANTSIIEKTIIEELKEVPRFEYKLYPKFDLLIENIQDALLKKVKPTEQINELIVDTVLQEWVRKGKEIHENSKQIDNCLFCGSKINDNFWYRLSAHFNKESDELREQLFTLKEQINSVLTEINNIKPPSVTLFYNQFRDEWFSLELEYYAHRDKLIESMTLLLNKIEEKVNNIFSSVTFKDNIHYYYEEFRDSLTNLEQVIKKHESLTIGLDERRTEAREQLLELRVISAMLKFQYKNKVSEREEALSKYNRSLDDEETYLEIHKKAMDRLEELNKQIKETSRAAQKINELLCHHFGHNSLSFVAINIDGIDYYKILRGEEIAKNLSDGEKSLLSFCYFIVQLDEYISNHDTSNLIIYIDDPISSLDNGHIFFIFSLIEEKIFKKQKFAQAFVSTHNLDFMKYLLRITKDKIEGRTVDPNYYLVEREQKLKEYKSVIYPMPSYMSLYTTEYHYLFSELINFIKPCGGSKQIKYEKSYTKFYNVPNNLRKFLEYFMLTKFPSSNKAGIMHCLENYFGQADAIYINRVINEYSHLSYLDRGWKPLEIPELEKCVGIVFLKISQNDLQYFYELLTLIGEPTFDINQIVLNEALQR